MFFFKILLVLLIQRFSGYTIQMEDRMTLCNMVVEAGGKNGVIADQVTFNYLEVCIIKGLPGNMHMTEVYIKHQIPKTLRQSL